MIRHSLYVLLCSSSVLTVRVHGQESPEGKLMLIDSGWSNNSINAAVFRKGSIASLGNFQLTAFYSADSHVVLARRRLEGDKWETVKTSLTGNTADAHNVISIAIDGDGYVHLAWDHHNSRLRYCKSIVPLGLQMGEELPMTGSHEGKVTYPEFHRLPSGDLLFLYRDGASGNGNLVVKRYDVNSRKWKDIQQNLIDGEQQRNAYWQSWVDKRGLIHISWVWRESPDVASNHDLCYAVSKDGGLTWQKSSGEKYRLPITQSSAEYVLKIPQGHELINQTSITADDESNPVIATYWRDEHSLVPQFRIAFRTNDQWEVRSLDSHTRPFSLSGGGTKRIPVSRPQVLAVSDGKTTSVCMIFRDEERKNQVSVAITPDVRKGPIVIKDIYKRNLGQWEPTFDMDLWKSSKVLALFVQQVEQLDSEQSADQAGTPVGIFEWKPFAKE